jgi:hypothetical protein
MCENCNGKGEVLKRVYVAEKYGKHVVSYYTFRKDKCACTNSDAETKYVESLINQQEGTDSLV